MIGYIYIIKVYALITAFCAGKAIYFWRTYIKQIRAVVCIGGRIKMDCLLHLGTMHQTLLINSRLKRKAIEAGNLVLWCVCVCVLEGGEVGSGDKEKTVNVHN